MKFFGVTRFSVYSPGSQAWRMSSPNYDLDETYRDKLYSKSRMNERFNVFFSLAMPVYEKMQHDYDYVHIIQYSPSMPKKWLSLLFKESEKYPFIKLCPVEEGESVDDARRSAIKNLLDKDNYTGVYAWFRVDDDDLLPVDYLETVSPHINENSVGYIVSLGKGVTALYDKGYVFGVKEIHHPLLGLGMLYICYYDHVTHDDIHPKSGGHQNIDKSSPVILDSRGLGFLWLRHADQDTERNNNHHYSVNKFLKKLLFMPSVGRADMDRKFPFCSDTFIDFFAEEKNLFKGVVYKKNPAKVELKLSPGSYYLPVEVIASNVEESMKAGLISFIFTKDSIEIDRVSLSKSPREDIGWFSYVSSGYGVTYIFFTIPEGVFLDYVQLRVWSAKFISLFKVHEPIKVS